MVDPREESLSLVESRYSEWRRRFAAERDRIDSALRSHDRIDRVRRIEHVGSTSVPDLPAKDIVDLDVIVDRGSVPEVADALVAELGGTRFENSETWHPIHRTHEGQRFNVHVFDERGDGWQVSVVTAAVLREYPDLRDEYGRLKRDLAREHDDLAAYSGGKTAFLGRLLDVAREDDDLTFEFTVPRTP